MSINLAEQVNTWAKYLEFDTWTARGKLEPIWLSGNKGFWFVQEDGREARVLQFDAATFELKEAVDSVRLRDALVSAGLSNVALAQILTAEPKPRFVNGNADLRFGAGGATYLLRLDDYQIRLEPLVEQEREIRATAMQLQACAGSASSGWVTERASPDGAWVLTEVGFNLAIRSVRDGRNVPLTADGEERWAWRIGDAVWSPDGQQVLAQRQDYRELPGIPIVHWLKNVEEVEYCYPYTKTEYGEPKIEVAFISVPSARRLTVDLASRNLVALSGVGWRGEYALLHGCDPEGKRHCLLRVDKATGSPEVLIEEPLSLSGAYCRRRIEARAAAVAQMVDHCGSFLWPSDRSGWNHLYLYSSDGLRSAQLTKGDFDVEEVLAVDEVSRRVFFYAHADYSRPFDSQLCSVRLDGTEQSVLTEVGGDHEITFSPGLGFYLDVVSTVTIPERVSVRSTDGKRSKLLQDRRARQLAIVNRLGWEAPEEFTVSLGEPAERCYGVLYRPPNFDSESRYPVVEVIYAGFQLSVRPTRFNQTNAMGASRGVQALALAQLGFVVVVLDTRGIPGRGVAFQEAVRGRMGQIEIPDHARALMELARTRPWMDLTRCGVVGHSWGGYMAVRALLTAPELYRVGVASAAVVDQLDHQGRSAKFVMGDPGENTAGFVAGSNLPLVENLRGHLLLAHGTSDLGATFSTSMKMCDALVKAGKPFDLLVFPEATHSLTGQTSYYFKAATARYLVRHLSPNGIAPEEIPLSSSSLHM